jgi:predicted nucleotidyltransferase
MDIEAALARALREDSTVVAAYLFGSHARGTDTAASDVDIAVLFEPPPPSTLSGLPESLHARLEQSASREVDLLILNTASPDVVHRVLRDGRLLVDRDPGARIRFEVRSRNAYLDILPVLEEYRRTRT